MRSIRWLAVVTGTLALGSACGGDGPGPNPPPVANFTQACTELVCIFDDTSTPEGGISSWDWLFGDPNSGTNTASIQNPSHTFSAAGTYTVSLTVADADGVENIRTNQVTVAEVANVPPVAGFTSACNGGACTFTNTSMDADGTLTYAWNFGDPGSGTNNTSILEDPTHTYTVTVATDFTVTLTVTDNDGATDIETQTVTINPPAGLECGGVECALDITSNATVTITVTAADCEFTGNAFAITAPIQEQVFADGCTVPENTVFNINGGAAFTAPTSIEAQFTQGAGGPASPPKGEAQTRVTGAFPTWTIEFDDGGNPTGPGEPDFNDIILTVQATVVP